MIEGFEEFMVHTVRVETKSGEDPWGNTNTALSEPVPGFLVDGRHLVRSPTGDQIVSETTFYTGKEHKDLFPPESLVHLPDRISTVIKASVADSGPLDLPDHLAVVLT